MSILQYEDFIVESTLLAKPYFYSLLIKHLDAEVYQFTTDRGTYYRVSIFKENNEAEISFESGDEPIRIFSTWIKPAVGMTNKFEQYRVISTVIEIFKDFRSQPNNKHINVISFLAGESTKNERSKEIRTKWYKNIIRKMEPEAKEITNNTSKKIKFQLP